MKIEDLRITRHRLELSPPFPASWDPKVLKQFDITLLRVTTDEGVTGIASGDAMIALEQHKDLFIGEDPFDFERHSRVLDSLSLFYSRCWPLDLALWDLKGKVENQPVYKLLGGSSGKIPVYASTGVVRPIAEQVEQAGMLRDSGFKAMKLRIGRRPPTEDAKMLREVRKVLGDEIDIMVDANQAWRMPWDNSPCWTFQQAKSAIEEISELNIYWVEEPLHRGDFEGLKKLRSIPGFPRIASGEMNTEYHELYYLMEHGCVDVLQTDCVYFGGITGLAKVARAAQDYNVTFSPHAWGNGIGMLANMQLVAGTVLPPYMEYSIDPPQWQLEYRDFMLTELVAHDGNGYIHLGEKPGLGFELDEDVLEKTRIKEN